MAYQVIGPIYLPTQDGTASPAAIAIASLGLSLVNDDYITIDVVLSATSGTIAVAGSGWTEIVEDDAPSGPRLAAYYCKVAAGTVADPTFSSGTSGNWMFILRQWRAVDTTTPFPNSVAADTGAGNASSVNTGTMTPSNDNSVVIYSSASNGGAQKMNVETIIGDAFQQGSTSQYSSGFQQQEIAAATGGQTWYCTASTRIATITYAIKNAASGIKKTRTTGRTKLFWMGGFGSLHESVPTGASWGTPDTFCSWAGSHNIDGIVAGTTAVTLDNGYNPNIDPKCGTWTRITLANSTAGEIAGAWFALPAVKDLSNGLVSIEFMTDAATSPILPRGFYVGFGDSATSAAGNAKFFKLSPLNKVSQNQSYTAVIDVSNGSAVTTEGSFAASTVNKIGFFYHRGGSSVTSRSIAVRNIYLHTTASVVGGGAADPVTWADYSKCANSWFLGVDKSLSVANLLTHKVRIGDGATTTYFDSTATLLAIPDDYSAITQPLWNVPTNTISVDLYPSASDTINLKASSVISESIQGLTINASGSTSAAISFAGQVFSGVNYTDSLGITLDGGTFTASPTVTLKGSVTGITVSNTTEAVGGGTAAVAQTANNKTIASSTISCVRADAGVCSYHLSLVASVTAITLNTVTLTGTPGTDKIYSALASGTLTITVDGLGTALVAGDVTFVGGSTAVAVIAAPALYQKVTISGITTGARVQIYDTTSSTELFNGTASAGNTVVTGSTVVWTDPVAAAANRAIRVRVSYVSGATAKNFIETSGLTCGQTAGTNEITYPVSPTDDTVYNANAINGSTVTGVTFTDAATDVVNINVVANSISWKTIYAAWVYYVFGATGIASDIDYIDAVDEANYILSNMIIKNTSSPTAPLEVTGGYGRDFTTGATIDLADTTGGTLIFAPDHVVSYAVGSGVTAQDKTDIIDGVWSRVLPL